MPQISVLMPVYNGEKHLHESINSILLQSFADFEFIIINDGSTDESESIILSYNDPRIVYVKNENNLGLILTLNKGIEHAKGNFIARMDQDDISSPERFQKQINVLINNPQIGVCGSWFTLFGENLDRTVIKHPEKHDEIKIRLLAYCTMGHPTVMIRTTLVKHDKYDPAFQACEDYDLWVRLSEKTFLHNIPESLLNYRMHDTNMTVLEGSLQQKNSEKIQTNQLKRLGLELNCKNVEFCRLLFSTMYIQKISTEEIKKIVSFANLIERQNIKTKIYNSQVLQDIILRRLFYIFEKTNHKSLSLLFFLYNNRRDFMRRYGIKNTIKLAAQIILKKNA